QAIHKSCTKTFQALVVINNSLSYLRGRLDASPPSRCACIASALTQGPGRKDGGGLPLGRSLKDGLYATQECDDGGRPVTLARRGYNHYKIAFLKVAKRAHRQPAKHLLKVSAAAA